MTRDEIMELTMEGIEERKAAIREEIKNADDSAVLDSLEEELNLIEDRVKTIEIETRKADMDAVVNGLGETIKPVVEERK